MGPREALTDFGAFYARTYPRAFRVAYALTGERGIAEDVTQDAYLAAYRSRAKYKGDGPPDAWLYRIVVNTARSALRRQRVRFVTPLDPAADPPAGDPPGDRLDAALLTQGLRHLDPRARSAVVLRYYLDCDYATIGEVIGASPDNVGVILTRALGRLRQLLAPAGEQHAPAAGRGMAREARDHG